MGDQFFGFDSKTEDIQESLKEFIELEVKKTTRNSAILFETFKKETQEIKDKLKAKESVW